MFNHSLLHTSGSRFTRIGVFLASFSIFRARFIAKKGIYSQNRDLAKGDIGPIRLKILKAKNRLPVMYARMKLEIQMGGL
jgi:hypothetical protein